MTQMMKVDRQKLVKSSSHGHLGKKY